jgi:dienelactone hydrolase
MTHRRRLSWLAALLLAAIALPATSAAAATRVEFASLDQDHPFRLSGMLYLPQGAPAPSPAIVLIHGSAGIDARGAYYRGPLLAAGVAVLEVDFKTGNFSSPSNRPPIEDFVPAAFAALRQLRQSPAIDPARVGVMGFSMGGGITVRTALEDNRKRWLGAEPGFAAHVAFYPVCRYLLPKVEHGSGVTGAPMIVFYGSADVYGDGTAVPELKALLQRKFRFELTTVEYPGAAHGFNLDAPPLSYPDPAAKGGRGYMAYDAAATADSLPKVVAFVRQSLAVK